MNYSENTLVKKFDRLNDLKYLKDNMDFEIHFFDLKDSKGHDGDVRNKLVTVLNEEVKFCFLIQEDVYTLEFKRNSACCVLPTEFDITEFKSVYDYFKENSIKSFSNMPFYNLENKIKSFKLSICFNRDCLFEDLLDLLLNK